MNDLTYLKRLCASTSRIVASLTPSDPVGHLVVLHMQDKYMANKCEMHLCEWNS